jgi:hypothetical protein
MDPRAPERLRTAATLYPAFERCHDGGLTAENRATISAPLLVAGRALMTDDVATTVALLRR